MIGKKLILAGLSSALLVGAAATASFAAPANRPDRPGPHMGMGGPMQEVLFVRMLKEFDTNKDGKITKDEAMAGFEKIFAAIDTDKDGSLTPGELRKYHEAQMKDRKDPAGEEEVGAADAPPPPPGPNSDQAMNDDQGQPPAPPPPGGDHDGPRWHHGPKMMRISMLMRRADTDENGQISKAEATVAFTKLFDRMDRNKDGVISIDDMPDRPFL